MEELPDNHLYQLVNFEYKLLGMFNGKATIWTWLVLAGFLGENIHLTVSLYADTFPSEMILQYYFMGGIAVAAFAPMYKYRKEIFEIAQGCETLPVIDVPWNMRRKYNDIKIKAMNTLVYKLPLIQSSVVVVNGTLIVFGPILIYFILGVPLRLPFSDTNENIIFFVLIYIGQSFYYVFCVIAFRTSVMVFGALIQHLKIQYELLGYIITEHENPSSVLTKCLVQHQNLIKLFDRIKIIFKQVFIFVYFFLFLSTALTREILVKQMDATFLLIILSETGYLLPHVTAMEGLMDEAQNFRKSLFYSYGKLKGSSKTVYRSLIIAMIRLSKNPGISIYLNGPSINNDSYASLINATFTYLASGILMNRLLSKREE